jgi:hypothetical protein
VRPTRYGVVSTALALLPDDRLGRLVEDAPALGSGIGGATALMDVGGVPVFVKRIPLTDLEREPRHVRSTANLFGLPTFCQYGVGSPGFGAWRELAANVMATNWVLAGHTEAFPLLYHWRVLPGAVPFAGDVDREVAYWHGSPALRRRLDGLAGATASLVLFLEYIPRNLRDWLAERLAAGPDALSSACALVERRLRTDVAFLGTSGLWHFDAHFRNILTDGRRLYFGDLGLATSTRFDLSGEERDFLARNAGHDRCHTLMELVNWLVVNAVGIPVPPDGAPVERNGYVRRCAAGATPEGVPAPVAAIISRYAPVAAVMNDFYWRLFGESRNTPFPAEDLGRLYPLAGVQASKI